MDFGQFFIADAQAAKLMQPRDRALDDPTQSAQARPVRQTPPCDAALDAALRQRLPMRPRLIGSVPEEALRAIARRAPLTTDWRDCIDQRQQLRHIVRISAREDRCQWDAVGIRDQMMLGAGLATIRRIRSSFFPQGQRVPTTNRPRHATNRVARVGAVRPAASHAVVPRRRLAANRASDASRSYRNSRVRPAASPTEGHS